MHQAIETEKYKIVEFVLDEKSVRSRNAEVEKERAIAIYDLLEQNYFKLLKDKEAIAGPYIVALSLKDYNLVFDIADAASEKILSHISISIRPFRKTVQDYFFICESYYQAIKDSSPCKIEAIDMGRRALHDEGAELVRRRLRKWIEMDYNTSRRFFTLICVLHFKG